MATGYIVSGRGDLDVLFKPRTSAAIANTGFRSNGAVDLAQRFEPRGSTTAIANTGFRAGPHSNADLAALFMDINASSTIIQIDNAIWTANAASNPTSGYMLESDGDIQRITNGSLSDQGDWVNPKSAAPGPYRARVTMISGTLSGGDAVNTWLPLTSDRVWTLTRPSPPNGNGTTTARFLLEIDDGAGNVLDTADITLNATIP